MSATIIRLSGGDLGHEEIRVRCNLTEASTPVQVDYCTDAGHRWEPTQYQCADCRHRRSGLIGIGKRLAANAVGVPEEEFSCQAEDYYRYTVSDGNSADSDLEYSQAVQRIADWYEDLDEWATGDGDEAQHAAIRAAIDGCAAPSDDGGLGDLRDYAQRICQAVVEAIGVADFAGHGGYYVAAADRAGLTLTVVED